jgi:hypothetical protein
MKPGDKIICVKPQDFVHPIATSKDVPKIGLIYTISHFEDEFVCLIEIPYWLHETDKFRPIDDNFAHSVIEKVTEQIKEEELVNG